ncbi:hypothetical protein fugu_011460 [Takifugu bimaculatus]|uniref:Uncharacterized protein n=1 Tax=Takifugu bimaculatus TaxID=433685 RepID=A0A4Z2C7T1_9TELE|nr:hypothetical protein fugu_011460 [Takifugu bimaculatus]
MHGTEETAGSNYIRAAARTATCRFSPTTKATRDAQQEATPLLEPRVFTHDCVDASFTAGCPVLNLRRTDCSAGKLAVPAVGGQFSVSFFTLDYKGGVCSTDTQTRLEGGTDPGQSTVFWRPDELAPWLWRALAGGVILGVALWLRHDNQTSSLLILQFEGHQAPGTFYISVYILIAVGAVMMLVGFLGCYGAIQESQCLLGTFFFFLVILFACEVAAAIWGFMNRDTVSDRDCFHPRFFLGLFFSTIFHPQISKELINFYDSAYIKAVDVSGSPSKDAAIKVLDVFHTTLDCCGKGDDTALFKQVASTLCPRKSPEDFLKSQSCHDKLVELFSEKLYLIGLAALVVGVIMIFEMIFTMVLCCGIRNSPGVY